MKRNPGRKERRNNLYHKSFDAKGKSVQSGHGQPNTLHAMGTMTPTLQTNTHTLTNKRMEMLKKHPERRLPSERSL